MDICITGFNGMRLDPLSKNTHLGNGYRAYNPAMMRFLCPDSLSPYDGGGINIYSYCMNDPVNRADPSGHISLGGWLGIAGGIAGVILAPFSGGGSLAITLTVAISSTLSGVLAIASGVLEERYPETSVTLGWLSLGTGLPAILAGAWKFGQTLPSIFRQSIAFINKLERGERYIGIALSGRGAAGAGRLYSSTMGTVTSFDVDRILYEMEAYDALRTQLNLPERVGARPELGLHRRIVHVSQPRLPVYSQELRELYPVPEHLDRQLNAFYEQLNIRNEMRSFRVSPEPQAAPALRSSIQNRALPAPPQRPLPPPPYFQDDPHPLQAYSDDPTYIARRGNPPDYNESESPET